MDYLAAHARGAAITPKRSKYLYIPLEKSKSGRVTAQGSHADLVRQLSPNTRMISSRSSLVTWKRLDPTGLCQRRAKKFPQAYDRAFKQAAEAAAAKTQRGAR